MDAHGPLLQPGEAVGGDEVQVLVEQHLYERRYVLGRIGAIGVQGDDDVALGLLETGLVGPAIAAARLLDDHRPLLRGDLPGAVLGVGVHDQHLVVDPAFKAWRTLSMTWPMDSSSFMVGMITLTSILKQPPG